MTSDPLVLGGLLVDVWVPRVFVSHTRPPSRPPCAVLLLVLLRPRTTNGTQFASRPAWHISLEDWHKREEAADYSLGVSSKYLALPYSELYFPMRYLCFPVRPDTALQREVARRRTQRFHPDELARGLAHDVMDWTCKPHAQHAANALPLCGMRAPARRGGAWDLSRISRHGRALYVCAMARSCNVLSGWKRVGGEAEMDGGKRRGVAMHVVLVLLMPRQARHADRVDRPGLLVRHRARTERAVEDLHPTRSAVLQPEVPSAQSKTWIQHGVRTSGLSAGTDVLSDPRGSLANKGSAALPALVVTSTRWL
ncbi:hypothetical protein C8R43DRAFT_948694 [Mycena crocata]|nr:hypothetical protein C8R43DRAFT_948694 [Mycena crocata]